MAKERNYSKLVAVTKRNILKETDGIFWNSVEKISRQFQGINVEEYYVDNMTQQLVKNPERFNQNILLSTNLFMDIISECASGHVGSIGNVYSGNFGENYAMFEPAHGSAPKYSGMDKVNPVASILSGAWLVRYLGETDISGAIFEATEKIVAEGKYVTYDLGGESSLSRMSAEISQKSSSLLRK
jgi:isocitrate dehydrogenase